jgi:hypothetical protein
MRLALRPHPDSRSTAVTRIDVEVLRPHPTDLVLRYEMNGDMARVKLPAAAASARADDLWRSTCFETFVRSPILKAYYELNFSPSTLWAAYRFSGYREGMAIAEEIGPPQFMSRLAPQAFDLDVGVDLAAADLPDDAPWRLALSAVVEDLDGVKSYWAWSHPAGKPDFHHPDAFACELSPP